MATTEQIQALADMAYAAQTTGVSQADYNAAKEAVGLDPNDYMATQEFLESYGYRPGTNQFYDYSTVSNAPVDAGLAAHHSAVQTAMNEYGYLESTPENLKMYSGKIDPNTNEPYKFMVNDNVANAQLIQDLLTDQGLTADSTVALTPSTVSEWQEPAAEKYTESYDDQEQSASTFYEGGKPIYENSLQWAQQIKKKTANVTTADDLVTGNVNLGQPFVDQLQQGTSTGTGTPQITPYVAGTPNIGATTAIGTSQDGLTEVAVPTYEQGLDRQADQFTQRATDQEQYYQPQTIQEQQAAGNAPVFENVLYRNNMGMSMYIQHINGVPAQPIPPGYYRVKLFGTDNPIATTQQSNQTETQSSESPPVGYVTMNKGGSVKGFSSSSLVTPTLQENTNIPRPQYKAVIAEDLEHAQRDLLAQTYVAPGGAVGAPPVSYIDPNSYGSVIESTAGQALPTAPTVQSDQVAQISSATTADTPTQGTTSTITADKAYSDIQSAVAGMSPEQLAGLSRIITAQQQQGTSVSDLDAATSQSVDVTGQPTRTEQTGEMITETGVDQAQVGQAFGTGEVQAASVQDELASLMQQFEGGATPAWAAGSMRAATATLSARGLGASSLAGQAVVQAAMEAALPIAQIDASNKQQTALFKAEQRAKFLQMDFDQAFQAKVLNAAKVAEIANMNFTAQQQIALENSKAANTMALQNLTNEQALVMSEAAALSQLDMANLNNRQQANVQNAQNFLQMDMANLSNAQQTAMFKNQSLISSILSDQAAENAALQFNATSENQTDQFFANLAASVNQFNAAQINAMKQYNADEVNALLEFNATIQNQREMFNAQNYLVVAQANAQWRQNLATINTAAANESNMDYAQTVNGLTIKSLDEIWQRERDLMDYAFTQSENAADRALSILMADKQMESVTAQLESQEDTALGELLTKVFFSSDFKSIFNS